MKILLACLVLFLIGCTQTKTPEKAGGYIVPDSCGTSWVCPGEPECDDEHLKFLCEDWSKK